MTPAAHSTGSLDRIEVHVTVLRGVGLDPLTITGEAPVPTVAQALAVLEHAAAATTGDPDATGLLRAVVTGWFPPRLAADARALAPPLLARLLCALVAECTDGGPGPAGGAPSGPGPDASPARFRRVLLDVARGYGWTMADALATPWPDFLDAARELGALRAADALRAMEAAHPSRAAVDRLVQQATGGAGAPAGPRAPVRPPWEVEGSPQAEYRRRKMRDLHLVQRALREVRGVPQAEA